MSSDTLAMDVATEEGFAPYRAVSKAAVLSLALALVSTAGILWGTFLILALVGALLGYVGYRSVTRYPNEVTGKPFAVIGMVLGAAVFVVGVTRHSYVYATEVPEGYERISFADLQPDSKAFGPVPDGALALDGKQVFIKGYIYPSDKKYNLQRFVLIPDLGTCCFGGQPKLTDMVEVTLKQPLVTEYSMRKRKLAGVFKVDSTVKPITDLGGVYYQLTADHIK